MKGKRVQERKIQDKQNSKMSRKTTRITQRLKHIQAINEAISGRNRPFYIKYKTL